MFTRNGLYIITMVIKNDNDFIKLTKLCKEVESLKMDPLRKKCLYSEFPGPYSVRMRENADQENTEY